jgi:hypothetical protein
MTHNPPSEHDDPPPPICPLENIRMTSSLNTSILGIIYDRINSMGWLFVWSQRGSGTGNPDLVIDARAPFGC